MCLLVLSLASSIAPSTGAVTLRRASKSMETSLRYDSNRRALCLFAKERFTNNEDVVLTVRLRSHVASRVVARRASRRFE